MKKALFFILILTLLSGCSSLKNGEERTQINTGESFISQPDIMTFTISTPAFDANNRIDPRYTCQGKDFSPAIQMEDIPGGAVSLALVIDDPDAPGGIRTHWVVWNIPVMPEIPEKTVPQGSVQGKNSWGNNGYGGPCPPRGEHRYIFKMYALDTLMAISEESTKEDLEEAMKDHIIQKAEMIGMYQKH